MTYRGHVHNGVIVLDAKATLTEGASVRIETLNDQGESEDRTRREERYRRVLQLLQEWNEEDSAGTEKLQEVIQEETADDDGMPVRSEKEAGLVLGKQ